jgi:hypothetical protein
MLVLDELDSQDTVAATASCWPKVNAEPMPAATPLAVASPPTATAFCRNVHSTGTADTFAAVWPIA